MEQSPKHNWVGLMPPFLLIATIIVICIGVVIALNGDTTTTKDTIEDVTNKTLSCKANGFIYPFFTYNNAAESTTQINIIFSKSDIYSISLTQKMEYDTDDQAITSEANNHAAMNKSFGNELGADGLNARYTVKDTTLIMNLFAEQKDLTTKARQFFLLDQEIDNIKHYKDVYESQGFECQEK